MSDFLSTDLPFKKYHDSELRTSKYIKTRRQQGTYSTLPGALLFREPIHPSYSPISFLTIIRQVSAKPLGYLFSLIDISYNVQNSG
jgi:hypothetical protein